MAYNQYYALMGTTYKICGYFDDHHIDSLRQGIHKLFRCAGDGKKWKDEKNEVSLKRLIKLLAGFVEDGFETLNNHTKDGFTYYNCGVTIKHPFIVGEKCLETGREKSYLRRVKAFQGEIQFLNEEEVANFYLPLKEFFLFDDRKNWKRKLREWKNHAKAGISIHDRDYDLHDKSTQSYFQLLKFLETCCIIHKAFNRHYGICPAWMLFESDQAPFYVDAYGAINPFEEINKFFGNDNAYSLKEKLARWMTAAKTKGMIWTDGDATQLIEFHDKLYFIIESCWLLYDNYFLLEDWLNPTNFDNIYPPVPEPSGLLRPDQSGLRKEEMDSPVLFLERCVFDSGVVYERESLRILLKSALSKDLVAEDRKWQHDKLPMIIDALYILNAWIFERHQENIRD